MKHILKSHPFILLKIVNIQLMIPFFHLQAKIQKLFLPLTAAKKENPNTLGESLQIKILRFFFLN